MCIVVRGLSIYGFLSNVCDNIRNIFLFGIGYGLLPNYLWVGSNFKYFNRSGVELRIFRGGRVSHMANYVLTMLGNTQQCHRFFGWKTNLCLPWGRVVKTGAISASPINLKWKYKLFFHWKKQKQVKTNAPTTYHTYLLYENLNFLCLQPLLLVVRLDSGSMHCPGQLPTSIICDKSTTTTTTTTTAAKPFSEPRHWSIAMPWVLIKNEVCHSFACHPTKNTGTQIW